MSKVCNNFQRCEFVGKGLRPPGKLHLVLEGEGATTTEHMTMPVFISCLHKLVRRNMTPQLKGLVKCGLVALSKREVTPGMKAVTTQFKNRVLMCLVEEGLVHFTKPHLALLMVHFALGMFDESKGIDERLVCVDKLCGLMNGAWRGRATSNIRCWMRADPVVLAELGIETPDLNFGDQARWWREMYDRVDGLNLATVRDKRVMRTIAREIAGEDTDISWILRLIPEVSHAEFKHFLVTGAVMARDRMWEPCGPPQSGLMGCEGLPSFEDMKLIGVFDCHSGKGKGGFHEFVSKGSVISNSVLAPINELVGGKSMKELGDIYVKVKSATGSKRFPNHGGAH